MTRKAKSGDTGPRLALETEVREADLETLDNLAVDALAVFIADDERPLTGVAALIDWRLCGRLSKLILNKVFTGALDQHFLVPTGGRIRANKLFLFGAGPTDRLDRNAAKLIDDAVAVLKSANVDSVAIALPHASAIGFVDDQARAPLGDKLTCVLTAWQSAPR